jgi:hypothetical protein
MEFLEKIMGFLNSIEGVAMTIAIVAEFILHLFKTEKPVGIVHGIVKMLNMVAALLQKIAVILDKIIPQNTKE